MNPPIPHVGRAGSPSQTRARTAAAAATLGLLGLAACLPNLDWGDVRFADGDRSEIETRLVELPDGEAIDLVRGEIDGVPGWFALDTGAQVAVIDDDLAARLDLVEVGEVRLNGSIPASIRRGGEFRLGSLAIADPTLFVLDLEQLFARAGVAAGTTIHGAIGYPLLRHATLRVAYGPDGDRIDLFRPGAYSLPDDAEWTPMRLVEGVPSIEARLEGDRVGRFQLDTGKSYTLSLSSRYVERHDLLRGRQTRERDNVRLEGVSKELWGELEWFEIGGLRIEPLAAGFRIPGTTAAEQEDSVDGVIGREILKRFVVVFDYPASRIALIPRGAPNAVQSSRPGDTGAAF